jgi:hypothetical protein
MYFVLTKRTVRVARDAGADRYAARHTNIFSWTVSGPFTKRQMAERAAIGAISSHTCLAAQVMSLEQLNALAAASSFDQTDYELDRVASYARKWLVTMAEASH